MEEEWRDIKGYENLYQVSNKGRVKSLGNGKSNYSKERLLKTRKNKRGYIQVNFSKDGKIKMFYVHRLVAETFIPNPNNYPVINHRDETPCNNCVENLEWCTQKYNVNYGTGKFRTAAKNSRPVKCLDLETNKTTYYDSHKEAEIKMNIGYGTISHSLYTCKSPYKNRYIFTEL